MRLFGFEARSGGGSRWAMVWTTKGKTISPPGRAVEHEEKRQEQRQVFLGMGGAGMRRAGTRPRWKRPIPIPTPHRLTLGRLLLSRARLRFAG